MRHAVQFFLNREAFKAFQRWQVRDRQQEHEEMVAKAVSAFVNRALRMAWNRWLEFCEQQAVATRCPVRQRHPHPRAADVADAIVELNEERQMIWKRFATSKTPRFEPRSSAGTRTCWRCSDKGKLTKAILRFKNKALAASFSHWSTLVSEHKHNMAVLQNAVIRLMNRQKRAALMRWYDQVQEIKRIQDLCDKILRDLLREAAVALERWKDYTQESLEMKEKMAQALGRLRNRRSPVPLTAG